VPSQTVHTRPALTYGASAKVKPPGNQQQINAGSSRSMHGRSLQRQINERARGEINTATPSFKHAISLHFTAWRVYMPARDCTRAWTRTWLRTYRRRQDRATHGCTAAGARANFKTCTSDQCHPATPSRRWPRPCLLLANQGRMDPSYVPTQRAATAARSSYACM
jgi:hypothetical protein